jgi:serine/threonine-protein kinase
MPSSDPRDLARNILRSLSESEATPPGTGAFDPLQIGRLAIEKQLLRAEQLDDCLRELKERQARGLRAELIDVLLDRGWLAAESVTKLLGEAPRPATGFPSIARFEIRDCIGEGASAAVYRAWDKKLHRWVALKVLRSRIGLSDVARERFRREAQASGGLSHPNVVTVHDAGEENGQQYLVMELVGGRPFSDVLRERTIPERGLLEILEKIARGVAAAHERQIVHRDLKPANFLVSESGEPKVGDFGLAHLANDSTALTRTGTTLGTPLYMAPEQVEGRSKDVSPRTDVYALGAVLYEILTGRSPNQGEATLDLYHGIVHDPPTPPRRINPKASPDLEAVALKALEKEPARRYPSAREFADELRRYLSGEAVLARLPGLTQRIVRGAKRRRAGLAMGLVVLLAAGISAYSLRISRPSAPTPAERQGTGGQAGGVPKRLAPAVSGINIPTAALALWLRADLGVSRSGTKVSSWEDQSGNRRSAVQSAERNQPLWIDHAAGDRPALRFDGGSSFMTFSLPVNGLRGMTIFLVTSSGRDFTQGRNGDRAAINWDESSFWGRVYVSPFRSNVRFRFGTTQVDNWPIYVKNVPPFDGFVVITTMKEESVDSLWLNGALVLREGEKQAEISACLDGGMLGKGMSDDCFAGDIAEVLVYTSALGDPDRRRVERYLKERYRL